MSEEVWSWSLFAAELVGLVAMSVLVGKRRIWWGWLVVAVFVSVPWIAYSVITNRLGFLALSLTWLTVHLTNARRWRAENRAEQTQGA
jgi:hypothetical protein